MHHNFQSNKTSFNLNKHVEQPLPTKPNRPTTSSPPCLRREVFFLHNLEKYISFFYYKFFINCQPYFQPCLDRKKYYDIFPINNIVRIEIELMVLFHLVHSSENKIGFISIAKFVVFLV